MPKSEELDSEPVTEAEGEESDPDSVPDAEDDFVAEAELTPVVEAVDASVLEAEDESVLVEEDEDDSDAAFYIMLAIHLPEKALTKFDVLIVLPAALQVSLYALSAASTSLPQSFLI